MLFLKYLLFFTSYWKYVVQEMYLKLLKYFFFLLNLLENLFILKQNVYEKYVVSLHGVGTSLFTFCRIFYIKNNIFLIIRFDFFKYFLYFLKYFLFLINT